MDLHHSDIFNKLLADHRDEIWVGKVLMMLCFESEEFKRAAERRFWFRCPFWLYICLSFSF